MPATARPPKIAIDIGSGTAALIVMSSNDTEAELVMYTPVMLSNPEMFRVLNDPPTGPTGKETN